MFKDKVKIYQLYHTVISTALTWALVLVLNRYFDLRVHYLLGIIYCIIPAALLYLFNIYKKNGISYIFLGSIIPALALIFWAAKVNPVKLYNDILSWCRIYDGSEELYVSGYANLIIFLAALLSSILFYLLTIKNMTKIFLGIVLFAALIVLSIYKFDISKIVVAICLLYILTVFLEIYEKIYTRKAERAEKREGILYLVPVSLLLAVLSVSMPSKPEPIQWKLFKSIYSKLSDQIEAISLDLDYLFDSSKSEFSINMTGYSERSGKLATSGKLVDDDKVTLKISGLKKDKSVYLIGSVSDTYTGSSWEKSDSGYLAGYNDYLLDFLELYYALSRQEPEVVKENKLIETNWIKILYSKIKTKTFFYPGKMSSYYFYSPYDKIVADQGQITFKKARGKGTYYQTIYYEMNLTNEAFIQILKDADNFSYSNPQYINNATADYLKANTLKQSKVNYLFEDNYYDVLAARSELIKETYTALPDKLPDRVYNLAETITEGSDTKYEKLKAIESYLINNYTYANSSPDVLEGEDYIDYFLFEEKSGYCTSFATAMAVLGRCIGIPTRYVEGYIARYEEMDEDSMYNVKNSYAHAWAEAYIEGIGWIPFEATAPYHDVRYTQWKDDEDEKDYNEDLSYYLENYYKQNNSQLPPTTVLNKEPDNKTEFREIFRGVIAFLAIIAVIFTIVMIYYNVLSYRYRSAFNKCGNSDKTYMLFLRILRLLKKLGFVMSPDETVIMFADRVKDYYCFEGISFLDVADIYMRYRYADEEVTLKDYEKVTAYQLGLANRYRSENSRWKVWLEELIFLSRRKALKDSSAGSKNY